MTLSRGKRIEAAAIGAVGMPVIEALGGTCTWIERGTDHLERIRAEGRQPIYALWHGRIMAGTLYLRDRQIVVITSENFDGEWVARIIRRFGYHTARGSTSRGGARALVQLRRDMRAGYPVAFTVDGPRGPARVAQPGAAWLASATGNPILPFHIEASAYWTMNSWDRHQVPKPGSVLAAVLGTPIEVAPGVDDEGIRTTCLALEAALSDAERVAVDLVSECRIERKR
ncbi:MAG: lysophospholipid acyltransferase family protein [Vicinamibacterales bacterium]